MIKFIKKATITTWIAFVVHVFIFSLICYKAVQKFGFNPLYLLIPIVSPLVSFYNNVKEYDK
jgi:hypothetical protein